MSILKGNEWHEVASLNPQPKLPHDDKGQFVPLACPLPECGGGMLRHQGGGEWECDGLIDPGHPDKPLEACWYFHLDGKPRVEPSSSGDIRGSQGG